MIFLFKLIFSIMRVEDFINEYFRLLVNEMKKNDEFIRSLNDVEITKEEDL